MKSAGKAGPRIAVLITYFNEGPLLRECIESIARQPGAPDEILVYDDASDAPPDEFIPADIPIKVIRGESNQGPAHGRNVLVDAATADFVHFHDADDLFAPGWATAIRNALVERDVDIVLTDLVSVRGEVTESPAVMGLVEGLQSDPDLVRFALRGALLLPSSTSRRSLVVSIGGFRSRRHLAQSEDFDFHVRLAAAAGERYSVVPRSLVIQRLRQNSHSSNRLAVWTSAVAAVRELSTVLPPQYRQDLSDAAARFASQLYQMDATQEGQAAASLARSLGRPRFDNQSAGYRALATVFGQGAAEGVGRAYRRLLPQRWRKALYG